MDEEATSGLINYCCETTLLRWMVRQLKTKCLFDRCALNINHIDDIFSSLFGSPVRPELDSVELGLIWCIYLDVSEFLKVKIVFEEIEKSYVTTRFFYFHWFLEKAYWIIFYH